MEGMLLRIGITGHMDLTIGSVPLVYKAITDSLALYEKEELTGVSCVARGADSIFAQAVLDLGGKLEVIIPADNYRETKVSPDRTVQFDELMHRATAVRVLPFGSGQPRCVGGRKLQ